MTGRELIAALDQRLEGGVQDALSELETRVSDWCYQTALDLSGGETPVAEDVRQLESAVMQLSGRTAHEQLTAFAGRLTDTKRPDEHAEIMMWADRARDASRGARTARNLLNHRRKIVSGVLNSVRRNFDAPEVQGLLMRELQSPEDLAMWALQMFDFYAVQARVKRDFQNNYRSEWLTFLEEQEPRVSESLGRFSSSRSRRSFEDRYTQAIQEFLKRRPQFWTEIQELSKYENRLQTALSYEPRGSEAFSYQQTVPVLSEAVSAASASGSAQVTTQTTSDGFIITFNADAYNVGDVDEAVIGLTMGLSRTLQPGEVEVEGLTTPTRQIRLILHTQNASSASKALKIAKAVFEEL